MPHDTRSTAEASNPTQLRSQTWGYIWRRTVQEFLRDGCIDAAAALTFFAVLAVFPAGLAIVACIGVVADSEDVLDRLFDLIEQVAPGAVTDTLRGPLTEVAGASTAGPTLIIAVLTAVWSASIYVGAFGRTLNRMYGVVEGRPYWKRKPAQIGVTVTVMLLVLVVVAVVVLSGPVARALGDAFGVGGTALAVWNVAKWPLLAVAVVGMVTILYKGTSTLKQPPLRWLSLGALFAIVVLSAASAGFVFYVSHIADYNRTFGAFTSVIVFLVWVFIVNTALLIGAEFNAELERGRQLQAGQPSEKRLQLPRRDTAASDRTERSRRITEERGAMLRRGETLPPRSDTVVARVRRAIERLRARGSGRRDG